MRAARFTIFSLLWAAFAVGPAVAQSTAQAPSVYHEIKMTAKSGEFDPSAITVKKGEKVRLIVTATDRDHGFQLDAFDVNQVLKKGDTEIIEFTASKAGTFVFKCSVPCGAGHRRMKGTLVVEE